MSHTPLHLPRVSRIAATRSAAPSHTPLAILPAAYGMARLSESLLYGVHAGDAAVYATSLGIICLVAFVACYIPSRRATRIDPIVALRYE